MNRNNLSDLIGVFAGPVLSIVGGLILLFRPDAVTALAATVLGWGFLAGGALMAIAAITGNQGLSAGLRAAGCIAVGVWLTRRPLSLVSAVGKLLGFGLLLGAVSGFRRSNTAGGRAVYLAEGLLGLILLVMPLSASRLVCTGIGLLLAAAGVLMLVNALRGRKRLNRGGDDIIDI